MTEGTMTVLVSDDTFLRLKAMRRPGESVRAMAERVLDHAEAVDETERDENS